MKTEPINLWLDDIRDPAKFGCVGWFWVKTAEDAIEALKSGRVEQASLDHDLTIQQTLGNDDGAPTGYTVVCWMEANNVWPPKGVKVHSMNPAGKARMLAAIKASSPYYRT